MRLLETEHKIGSNLIMDIRVEQTSDESLKTERSLSCKIAAMDQLSKS